MSQPKLNTSLSQPLAELPPETQDEIADIERSVQRAMRELILYDYGTVRQRLTFGVHPPADAPFAMGLRGASEAEWLAFLTKKAKEGTPLPNSNDRLSLAAYEMPHRYKSLLGKISRMLPPGADIATWPGFVPLALFNNRLDAAI